tara:strand:- start:335 stop:562 length:228 start_codon:yes stop_codon:yes gene_type:complete
MRRVLVRPKRGHYSLFQAQLQRLSSLQFTGGKESKFIDINSIGKVLEAIHKGKELLPEVKRRWEIIKPLFIKGLD